MKPYVDGFDGDAVHPDRQYVVGTNTGLRSWYVMNFHQPLRSVTFEYYWEGRGPHTSMPLGFSPSGDGDYPCIDNRVGFYAYYVHDYWTESLEASAPLCISGMIEGYGRSVVGSRGFRSERAVILGFALDRLFHAQRTFVPDASGGVVWAPLGHLKATDEEREKVREYLDRQYPEVPVFEKTADMLRVIPLSGKPMFTRYE